MSIFRQSYKASKNTAGSAGTLHGGFASMCSLDLLISSSRYCSGSSPSAESFFSAGSHPPLRLLQKRQETALLLRDSCSSQVSLHFFGRTWSMKTFQIGRASCRERAAPLRASV